LPQPITRRRVGRKKIGRGPFTFKRKKAAPPRVPGFLTKERVHLTIKRLVLLQDIPWRNSGAGLIDIKRLAHDMIALASRQRFSETRLAGQ
jgi:hypothetical protein